MCKLDDFKSQTYQLTMYMFITKIRPANSGDISTKITDGVWARIKVFTHITF